MNAFPLMPQDTVVFNISPHYPPNFSFPTKILTRLFHQSLEDKGISIFKYQQSPNFCITVRTLETISEILKNSLIPVLLDNSSHEPPFELDFAIECASNIIDEIDVLNIIAVFITPLGILLKTDFLSGIHTIIFPNFESYLIVIIELIQHLMT